jgi:hypothetical protein
MEAGATPEDRDKMWRVLYGRGGCAPSEGATGEAVEAEEIEPAGEDDGVADDSAAE